MKTKLFIALLVLAAVIGGMIYAHKTMSAKEAGAEGIVPPEATSKLSHDDQGQTVLTMDAATQARISLQTTKLQTTNAARGLRASGHVLDATSIVELAAEIEQARLASEVSQHEFERLETLGENGPAKARQAAEAQKRRDELVLAAANTKLVLTWSKLLADRVNTNFAQALANGEQRLVQLDLPGGEIVSGSARSAQIEATSFAGTVPAELIGEAPRVEGITLGQSLLFLVKTNTSALVPGAAINGYISSNETFPGVIIPRAALLRHQGATSIFLKTAEETFVRQEVVLDSPQENGWFSRTLTNASEVVINGAQTLLSEENKAQTRPPE